MKRKNTGITLIALVITIIVLLILAGVSISAVMGKNGIVAKAQKAKEETRAGEVQEVIDLWKTEVAAKELDENWGELKTEEDILDELIDSGKIEESEINRTKKIITIGSRIIDYNIEIYNPYEIRAFTTTGGWKCNDKIILYNKNTGEYEELGENVIVEVEGEIFDSDVSDYMYIGYEEDGYGYPDGTVIFDLIDYLSIRNESKYVKITVIKNGTVVTWEGNVEVIYPS